MFEVLTSEASYLRSLRVLKDHFLGSRELNETMVIHDRRALFSNLLQVYEVSEKWERETSSRAWYMNDNSVIIYLLSAKTYYPTGMNAHLCCSQVYRGSAEASRWECGDIWCVWHHLWALREPFLSLYWLCPKSAVPREDLQQTDVRLLPILTKK